MQQNEPNAKNIIINLIFVVEPERRQFTVCSLQRDEFLVELEMINKDRVRRVNFKKYLNIEKSFK